MFIGRPVTDPFFEDADCTCYVQLVRDAIAKAEGAMSTKQLKRRDQT